MVHKYSTSADKENDGLVGLLRKDEFARVFRVSAEETDALYALGASAIAPALTRAPAARTAARLLAGSAFIGLGLVAAFARFMQP